MTGEIKIAFAEETYNLLHIALIIECFLSKTRVVLQGRQEHANLRPIFWKHVEW